MEKYNLQNNDKEMVDIVKLDERKELQSEFETVTNEMMQLLSSFSNEQFNTTPNEGSWTAGQAAMHLVMVGSGFVELLNGPVKETERAPDEMVAAIKEGFLDFNIKMEAPEAVRPATASYEKENLLPALEIIKEAIVKAIQTFEMAKTCVAFEIPVLGFLSGLEIVNFAISHTKRHIHQLRKIYEAVAKKEVENYFTRQKNL